MYRDKGDREGNDATVRRQRHVCVRDRDYPTPPGHRNLRESELLSSEKSDDKDSPDNRVVQQTITDFDANIRDCLPPSKASLR